MKIGLLIVFRNAEAMIDVHRLITLFTDQNMFDICLVNNGSCDKIMELLLLIKEAVNIPISVIDAQKSRGHNAAIKVGVQHLHDKKDLAYVLCLQKFSKDHIGLLKHIFTLVVQQKDILKNLPKGSKRIVQRNVFSINGLGRI